MDSLSSLQLVTTVPTTDRDLYEQKYDAWRYGDEASLYSIAEDSREERQSDINSRASEVPSRANSDLNSRLSDPSRVSKRGIGIGASPNVVEVRWVSHDGENGIVDSEDGYEDANDYPDPMSPGHNSRRLRILSAACILFIVVMAVTLGVTLSQDSETSRSSAGSGVVVLDDVESGVIPGDTQEELSSASPSVFPSVSPSLLPTPLRETTSLQTVTTSNVLATYYLKTILSPCTQEYILLDKSTLQGQVFQQLLDEEVAAAEVEDGDQIFFDINRGPDFIRERYALLMLYLSTNGQGWQNVAGWMDPDTDVCDWFGVLNCRQRIEGSCAVLNLNLSKWSSCGLGLSLILL
jgi:hypothetical protein